MRFRIKRRSSVQAAAAYTAETISEGGTLKPKVITIGFFGLILWGACVNSTSEVCPSHPARVSVTLTPQSLPLGSEFQPVATARICGGTEPTPFVGIWGSSNSAVVAVDSLTGRSRAVAVGTAYVVAQYRTPGSVAGGLADSVQVTVRAN